MLGLFLGLKPIPGTWKTWNIQKMEAKAPRGLDRESNQATTQLMQAAALNKESKLSQTTEIIILSYFFCWQIISTHVIVTPECKILDVSLLSALSVDSLQ